MDKPETESQTHPFQFNPTPVPNGSAAPRHGANPAPRTQDRVIQCFNPTMKSNKVVDEQIDGLRHYTLELDDDLARLADIEAVFPMIPEAAPLRTPVEIKVRVMQKRRTRENREAVPQIPQLKPDHAKMIRSEGDLHLLEIVYGLPQVLLESIDSTYAPKNLKQYNEIQSKWLEEEKWLVGEKVKHPPTVDEHLADMERERLTLHFRVYYALTRPGEVERLSRPD